MLRMKNDLNIDAKFALSFKLYSDIPLFMPCIFCVPTPKLSRDGCRQREKVYRFIGCLRNGGFQAVEIFWRLG